MAKTLDELVAETMGAQVLMVLRLQVENEALKARIVELTPTTPVASTSEAPG